MRFIYICDECDSIIGEIELANWDETMLGFDALTFDEKRELLHLDQERRVGLVKAICDDCYRKKLAGPSLEDRLEDRLDYPSMH
jgi:hypothetical protein